MRWNLIWPFRACTTSEGHLTRLRSTRQGRSLGTGYLALPSHPTADATTMESAEIERSNHSAPSDQAYRPLTLAVAGSAVSASIGAVLGRFCPDPRTLASRTRPPADLER
jgi:hypothetical protein